MCPQYGGKSSWLSGRRRHTRHRSERTFQHALEEEENEFQRDRLDLTCMALAVIVSAIDFFVFLPWPKGAKIGERQLRRVEQTPLPQSAKSDSP